MWLDNARLCFFITTASLLLVLGLLKRHLDTTFHECQADYKHLLGIPGSLQNCGNPCVNFTCRNFFHNPPNASIYAAAHVYMEKHIRGHDDEDLLTRTHNCPSFISQRGYHINPLSQEEAAFPIAYSIVIHLNMEQVERLFRAIYRPQNVYCFHIDAKADRGYHKALVSLLKCFHHNAFIASRLETVTYAGYSRLQADINCMTDLLKHPIQWRYLVNLAGLAFPIMSNEEIVNLLKSYKGRNDIEISPRKAPKRFFLTEWSEASGRMVHTTRRHRPPPHNITISKGSAYSLLSRDTVQFVLMDQKAQDLLHWSNLTYSPDELFWATLHNTKENPQLQTPGSSGYPGNQPWLASFSIWGKPCQGRLVHRVCTFGVGDLPRIYNSHSAFANKFYMEYQPLALECMENLVEFKSRCPNHVI